MAIMVAVALRALLEVGQSVAYTRQVIEKGFVLPTSQALRLDTEATGSDDERHSAYVE